MKKNNEGFALMEILAVAVVVSAIFMTIYLNYFPLKAELDNRVLYNDVEAEYRAFYFRKLFANYNYSGANYGTKNYITVFSSGSSVNNPFNLSTKDFNYLSSLIEKLQVEELIVTDTDFLSSNYTGNMKRFIDFKGYKSTHGNLIILKLESGKYAAMDIDYTLAYSIDGNNSMSWNSGQSNTQTIKRLYIPKQVTSIADSGFTNRGIESIIFESRTEEHLAIGSYAFKGNKIKQLEIPEFVGSVGQEAFANNNMKKLIIKSKLIDFSINSFAGNDFYLTTISDDNNVDAAIECGPTIMTYTTTTKNWCAILGVDPNTVKDESEIGGRVKCEFVTGDIVSKTDNRVIYHIIGENNEYLGLTGDTCEIEEPAPPSGDEE